MAKRLINATVDAVDVNGILRRIDVNKLLDRVDFDRLIDKIDIDKHLEKVNWNRVVDKIDVDRIVARSNLDAIIARSSSGVCETFLDVARTQIVYIDQGFQRFGSLWCCNRSLNLPPKPGKSEEREVNFPDNRFDLALEVQGRYCGVLSRGIAQFLLDVFIIWGIFFLLVLLVETLVVLITGESAIEGFSSLTWYSRMVAYVGWTLLYNISLLYAFRHTVGMAFVGLELVNSDGSRTGFIAIVLRQVCEAFAGWFVLPAVVLAVLAWLRSDGRTLIDLITFTGLVFAWDARLARLRLPKVSPIPDGELKQPNPDASYVDELWGDS